MPPKSSDPRYLRTRREIQEAFMDLVVELDFGRIGVATIAARARVNRSTFYRHFKDKYELLEVCMAEWLELYMERQARDPPASTAAALPALIKDIEDHYVERRDFYLAILESGRFPAFHDLFTRCLEGGFCKLIDQLCREGGAARAEDGRRIAVFLSSACLGSLLHLLREGDGRGTARHGVDIARYALAVLRC